MAEPARLWAEIVPTTNCSLTPASNNLALNRENGRQFTQQ
jgi:hypothetical protein